MVWSVNPFATSTFDNHELLGGSWVVISAVRSKVTIVITHIGGFITTHEPPSIDPKHSMVSIFFGASISCEPNPESPIPP